ncbi:MAG: hypothetical protein JWL86_3799 [Rhizobium sp.]|nr:hypothetical protein [Rhizobium sp.]
MNVDTDALFEAHAHNSERAMAWLRFRDVSESTILDSAVMMRGTFELGILPGHTFNWTFTPAHTGQLAIVIPIYESCRIVDLLAVSRHDHSVWGCCTGAGLYAGRTDMHRKSPRYPIRLYKTLIAWLLANGQGVLPLSKSFFPLVQSAPCIVGDDMEHAFQIADWTFSRPAERHFLDCEAAEQTAYEKVGFEVDA